MAYDEELAQRIRLVLSTHCGITERKMFGGLAFLRGGTMCCGVIGENLVTRVPEEEMAAALRCAHVRRMDFTGRPLREIVYVARQGVATTEALEDWVAKGLAFAAQRGSVRRPAGKGRAGPTRGRRGPDPV